jgi:hypothetical protein
MDQTVFQEILRQEFSCYYIEDGFESGWEDSVSELASDSAIRLYRHLNDESIQDFLVFLEKLTNEPNHPFIETLSDETLIDWTHDFLTWKIFQEILKVIGNNLIEIKENISSLADNFMPKGG